MKRFNFIPTGVARIDGRHFLESIPSRLRLPILALCAVIIVLAGILTVDASQLHAAQNEIDEIESRRDRTQAAARAVAQIRVHVTAQQMLLSRVNAVRRHDLDCANELATIGNALPLRAWIASLHSDGTRWTIDGETRDPQAVAATLVALRRAAMLHAPALVSMRSSNESHPIDYQLHVERTP